LAARDVRIVYIDVHRRGLAEDQNILVNRYRACIRQTFFYDQCCIRDRRHGLSGRISPFSTGILLLVRCL